MSSATSYAVRVLYHRHIKAQENSIGSKYTNINVPRRQWGRRSAWPSWLACCGCWRKWPRRERCCCRPWPRDSWWRFQPSSSQTQSPRGVVLGGDAEAETWSAHLRLRISKDIIAIKQFRYTFERTALAAMTMFVRVASRFFLKYSIGKSHVKECPKSMQQHIPAQTRRAARRMLAAVNFIVDKKYGSGVTQQLVVVLLDDK